LNSNNTTVVDQGSTLFDVSVDIDQTPRPQSISFDIGSHEYLSPLSINSEGFDTAISIFPNPTSDTFMIDLKGETLEKVIFYNQLGQKIKEVTSNEVDVSKLSNGIYFVKITSESGKTATKKIIKN